MAKIEKDVGTFGAQLQSLAAELRALKSKLQGHEVCAKELGSILERAQGQIGVMAERMQQFDNWDERTHTYMQLLRKRIKALEQAPLHPYSLPPPPPPPAETTQDDVCFSPPLQTKSAPPKPN